jgi:hypothetical protein
VYVEDVSKAIPVTTTDDMVMEILKELLGLEKEPSTELTGLEGGSVGGTEGGGLCGVLAGGCACAEDCITPSLI